MEPQSLDDPWYFACDCGAKWYFAEQVCSCPRCHESVTSPERINPPWRKKWMTIAEAACQLAISKSKLYQMVVKEEIQHRRIGGAIRFAPEDVDAAMEDCKMSKRERRDAITQRKTPRRTPVRNLKL